MPERILSSQGTLLAEPAALPQGAGRSGDPSRCAPLDGARRAADRCPAAPAGFLHRQCRAAGHARRPGGQCSHVANGHFRVCRCVCRHADPGRPARRPVRPPARFHLRHAGVRRVVGAVRAGHVPRCAGGRPPAAGADRRRHGAAAAGNDPRPFPAHEKNRALGLYGAVFGMAAVAGQGLGAHWWPPTGSAWAGAAFSWSIYPSSPWPCPPR